MSEIEEFKLSLKNTSNLLDNFLTLIGENFSAHSVVLFQQNTGNNHAELISFFSQSQSIAKDSMIVQGKGLVGWILKNKEALIYHVAEPNLPNLGYYNDETEDSISSFMGISIAGGLVLCLDSKEKNFFNENKQDELKNFAKFIPTLREMIDLTNKSNYIEKYFYLFEQLSELKKNYMGWSVYLKKFLQILSLGSKFEYMAFASLSDKKGYYLIEGEYPQILETKEFPLSGGIVGWVFRNNVAVQSDGKRNPSKMPIFGNIKNLPNFCASACIPIQIDKNTVAVIIFASTTYKDLNNEFKLFTRLVSEDLAQFLEVVSLRYKAHKQNSQIV